MAKSAARSDEAKAGGGGFLGLVLATLFAAAGGGGFGFFLSGDLAKPASVAAPAAKSAAAKPAPAVPPASKLVELRPIAVNMGEPRSVWLRMQASLLVPRELEDTAELTGKITEDIVAYLRTTTIAAIESGSDFQGMREDLNERAKLRGGDQVRELLIQGLIVE